MGKESLPLIKEDLVAAFREFAQTLPALIQQVQSIRPATLTIEEAATYLGVHKDTVRKLIREKDLPHIRVAGRILLRPKTLDEYMAAQERISVG